MTAKQTAQAEVAVLIGRFRPFHNGHLALLNKALESAARVVVVLGSSFQARTPKNPFTWQECATMILECVPTQDRARIDFVPIRDYYNNERWVKAVERGIANAAPGAKRVVLVGHEKDATSFYLSMFPSWGRIEMPRCADIDATSLRNAMFETHGQPREAIFALLRPYMPDGSYNFLSAWWSLPCRKQLHTDAIWLASYRAKWTAPVNLAADALVICNDHVLLIERGDGAGAGLYAVPGGFLNKGERFYAAAVRELYEETNFGMYDEGLLAAYLKKSDIFDAPNRSPRGRIISMAHLFDLGDAALPEVQGRDDARRAVWVKISALPSMEAMFFEDHFHMLDHFLKLTED